MADGHIAAPWILFFILYGVTGATALFAALYLLLRRGNAFAPDITPPVRLRCWAAAFFGVAALGHVWWLLFYICSGNLMSMGYVAVIMLDYVTVLTTICGTQLAMFQDRRRPVWPVFAAIIPFMVLGGLYAAYPGSLLRLTVDGYALLLYASFACYVVIAIRQYGRWLRDNYADLERKEVWQSQLLSLVFILLIIFYLHIASNLSQLFVLHFIELAVFFFLLWRVETLPQLDSPSAEEACGEPCPKAAGQEATAQGELPTAISSNISPKHIERLLAEHCVETRLYLQHDLTVQQLAKTIGTNRYYLSRYFSYQGITYNTYINNLRINHFISRYQEVAGSPQPFTVQQLASESGYRSYSTFSLAFKQRMGQSVTAWMRDTAG